MIIAILQARTSSTRLPGKVLKPLMGKPMLIQQVARVKKSKLIDKTVIATSTDATDDALAALCKEHDIDCVRGSLDNVLDRFYQAAKKFSPETVVRLTGDCPLIDPAVIDANIQAFLGGDYDYLSNVLPPTFPDGLDTEVMRFAALERAHQEAKLPSELEHVTPYINRNPDKFRLGEYKNSTDLSTLRWTVDEPADYAFVSKIYQALYPHNPDFDMADVLALLKTNPELAQINNQFERNAGLLKSLEKDKDLKS